MHAFHLKTSVDNKKQKHKNVFKKVSFFSFVKGVVKKLSE